METQQIITDLVGALIFAIPITARAISARATTLRLKAESENKIAETVKAAQASLESRLTAAEQRADASEKKHAACELNVEHLQKQTDANNELIAAFSETKMKDDGIIRGMRKELDELQRILKTVEGRNHA